MGSLLDKPGLAGGGQDDAGVDQDTSGSMSGGRKEKRESMMSGWLQDPPDGKSKRECDFLRGFAGCRSRGFRRSYERACDGGLRLCGKSDLSAAS